MLVVARTSILPEGSVAGASGVTLAESPVTVTAIEAAATFGSGWSWRSRSVIAIVLPEGPTGAGVLAATEEREALTAPGTRRTSSAPFELVSRTEVAVTFAAPSTSPPKSVNAIAAPEERTWTPGVPASASGVWIDPSVVATVYFSPSRTGFPCASWRPLAPIASVATLSAASESAGAVSATRLSGVPARRRTAADALAGPPGPARSAVTVALPAPAAVPALAEPLRAPAASARSCAPGAPGS